MNALITQQVARERHLEARHQARLVWQARLVRAARRRPGRRPVSR